MTKKWILAIVCIAVLQTVHAGVIEQGGWHFNIVQDDDKITAEFEVINSTESNMTEIKVLVKPKKNVNIPADYKWNAVICGNDSNLDFKKEEEVTKFIFFKTKEETDLPNVDLSKDEYKIDHKFPDKWCEKTQRKGFPFKLSETDDDFEKEIIIKVPENVTEFRMYIGNGSVVVDAGSLTTYANIYPSNRQICKDSNGKLHTAYRGVASSLYYAYSTDNGGSWTTKKIYTNAVLFVGVTCYGGDDILVYYADLVTADLKGNTSTNGGSTFSSGFTMAQHVVSDIISSCEADSNGVIHCCYIDDTKLYYVNSTAWGTEVTVNDNTNDQTDICTLVVSPNNCVYILGQGVDGDDLDYWSKCLNGFGDANRVEIGAGGGYNTGSTISAAMVNKSGTLKMYAAWVDSGDLQFCEGTPGSAFSCSEIDAAPSYFPSLVASNGSVEILYLDYPTMDSNADLNKAYSLTDSISFTVTRGILTANVYYPQSRGSWWPSSNRVTNRHDFIYQDDGDLYYDYLPIASGTNTAPTAPTDISGFPTLLFVGNVLNVTASGSSDVDDDSITYYYQVYNQDDGVIKKNWSTTKTYTVQSSDLEDNIRVYAKAYDGTNYSSEYYETIYVFPDGASISIPTVNVTYYKLDGTYKDYYRKYNATNTNSVFTSGSAGLINNASSFDGFEDYITTPIQSLNKIFTISLWFKTSTSPNYAGILFSRGGSVVGCAIGDNNVSYGYFNCKSSNNYLEDKSYNIKDGNWHHLVYTSNNSHHFLYRDGVLRNSEANTGTFTNTDYLKIGVDDLNLVTRDFIGQIDEVAIWRSHSLNSTQISKLYNDGVGLQAPFNDAPSPPTEITGFPTTLFVGNVLNVTASGAYDPNGDSLTYYYKFYNVNDLTIRQDWSTTKTYTTQSSDSNDVIRVYAKAYDGSAYSGEYYEDDTVEVATVEFAIGYPSTGCTSGYGSTDEDAACERCAFVTTDLSGAADQTQIGCEGQDSSTGFYVISNTGNVAVSWRVKMNASINTAKFRHKVALTSGGYQATCSGNATTGCAYVENTTQKLLVSNLAVDGEAELWAWADFINVYPSDTAIYTMKSNVTQT